MSTPSSANKIFTALLLLFFAQITVFGAASPSPANETYQCAPLNPVLGGPMKLKTKSERRAAGEKLLTGLDNSGAWYDFWSNKKPPIFFDGRYLCGGVNDASGKAVHAKSVSLDYYDFATGASQCSYVLEDDTQITCRAPDNKEVKTALASMKVKDYSRGGPMSNGYWTDAFFYTAIGTVDGMKDNGKPFFQGKDYARDLLNNNPNQTIDVWSMAKKHGLLEPTKDDKQFKLRFSNFFTGVLLLDDTFITGVDKATGAVTIAPNVEKKLTFLDMAKNRLAEKESEDPSFTVSASFAHDLSRVIDRQALGLYVNFFSFFMNAFNYFAGIMLLVAGSWFGFHAASKAGIKFIGKDKGQETDYKMKLSGIALTFALAFMPFNGGVQSSLQNQQAANAANGAGQAGQEYIDTTFAKNVIAFFAQYGADFANHLSDGIYVAALDYYLKRFGWNTLAVNEQLLSSFKDLLISEKRKEMFFAAECKQAYDLPFGSFSDASKSKSYKVQSTKNGYVESPYATTIFDYDNIFGGLAEAKKRVFNSASAVSISPNFCASLERDIQRSASIVKAKVRMIDQMASASKNMGDEGFKRIKKFVDNQLDLQAKIGWVNIVSLPLIETYVTANDLMGKINGAAKNGGSIYERTTSIVKNAGENGAKTLEDIKSADTDEINIDESEEDGGLLQSAIQYASGMSLYFVLPGFDGIYSMVSGMIRGIANSATAMITLVGIAILGAPATGGASIAAGLSFMVFSLAKSIAIMFASLLLSIYIYSIVIKTAFMLMVVIMILVKIFFFFLSLLKYFFITPFALFLQLTNDDKSAIGKFLGKGFVLVFVKPLLIVITVAIFIITYELLISLYSMLFSLGANTMLDFHNAISPSSGMDFWDSIAALSMVATIGPAGKVLLDFFSILVAYSIIMNGDKWLLNMLGYQEDDSGDVKGLVDDIRQKVGKV